MWYGESGADLRARARGVDRDVGCRRVFLLSDVTDVWVAFDRIERLAASAKMLFAARLKTRVSGSGRRAFRGGVSGDVGWHVDGRGAAFDRNSREVATLPEVRRRCGRGVVGRAGGCDRAGRGGGSVAQARLVGLAQTTNVTELREECLRTKAGADPDPDATHGGSTRTGASGRTSMRKAPGTSGRVGPRNRARLRSGVGTDHRRAVRTGARRGSARNPGRRTRSTR